MRAVHSAIRYRHAPCGVGIAVGVCGGGGPGPAGQGLADRGAGVLHHLLEQMGNVDLDLSPSQPRR